MPELYSALAEELERLAAGYRSLAGKEISIRDISIVLNEKMSKEKQVAIKSLLNKYNAKKLVEVKEEDYKEFYADAMRL